MIISKGNQQKDKRIQIFDKSKKAAVGHEL